MINSVECEHMGARKCVIEGEESESFWETNIGSHHSATEKIPNMHTFNDQFSSTIGLSLIDTSTFVTKIKTIKIMNGNACSPLPLLRILVWKYEHISFCLNKFAGAEPDETDSKLRDSTVYKHAINLFHCHTLIPYTSAQREFIIFAEIILWLCWCVRNTKYNI